jgi:hypothetical protein
MKTTMMVLFLTAFFLIMIITKERLRLAKAWLVYQKKSIFGFNTKKATDDFLKRIEEPKKRYAVILADEKELAEEGFFPEFCLYKGMLVELVSELNQFELFAIFKVWGKAFTIDKKYLHPVYPDHYIVIHKKRRR